MWREELEARRVFPRVPTTLLLVDFFKAASWVVTIFQQERRQEQESTLGRIGRKDTQAHLIDVDHIFLPWGAASGRIFSTANPSPGRTTLRPRTFLPWTERRIGSAMDSTDRFRRIRELYGEAVDLPTDQQRQVVLEKTADDPELRREVFELLGYAEDPRVMTPIAELVDLIDSTILDDTTQIEVTPGPATIGRYQILRRVGVGGMGTVFEALQDSPNRRVALKVLRSSVFREDLARRFRFESETLGRLQHPAIAQVYEACHEEKGESFIAMEFIEGRTLDRFVLEVQPSLRELLKLLATICDGIHHAHTRGIVHRDLKPTNIIVDVEGHPKIIDFGIARAIVQENHSNAITSHGEYIGTVAYMSPEQASAHREDIDTRSDVYSLGIVAYQLIVGQPPRVFDNLNLAAALRRIAEEPIRRPSAAGVSIPGDLETILMMACEQDRDRRYQSAAAFGSDLRAFLDNRPISARPPSGWYQARMLARRHRVLFAGVVSTFLTLVGGIVATTLQAKWKEEALVRESAAKSAAIKHADEATRQKGEALAAKEAAELAREASDRRLEETRAVQRFLERVIAAARAETKGRDVKVVDALAFAAERIERDFGRNPVVESAVRVALGKTFQSLGLHDEARKNLKTALEIRESTALDDPALLAEAQHTLGVLKIVLGEFDDAEDLIESALKTYRALLPKNPDVFRAALVDLATARSKQGNKSGAVEIYKEAIDLIRSGTTATSNEMAITLNNYGLLLRDLSRFSEAESVFRDSAAMFEMIGRGASINAVITRLNLALVLHTLKKLDESEELYRLGIAAASEILGPTHDMISSFELNFAAMLVERDKKDEAELIVRRVVQTRESRGTPDQSLAHALSVLGGVLRSNEKYDESEETLTRCIQIHTQTHGPGKPDTLAARESLVRTIWLRGDRPRAFREYESVIVEAKKSLDPLLPQTGIYLREAGVLLRELTRFEESAAYLREAFDRLSQIFGVNHSAVQETVRKLIETLKQLEATDEIKKLEALLGDPSETGM